MRVLKLIVLWAVTIAVLLGGVLMVLTRKEMIWLFTVPAGIFVFAFGEYLIDGKATPPRL